MFPCAVEKPAAIQHEDGDVAAVASVSASDGSGGGGGGGGKGKKSKKKKGVKGAASKFGLSSGTSASAIIHAPLLALSSLLTLLWTLKRLPY